jgi:hypothetical protein
VLQARTTDRFNTLVSWALFSVWLAFNILDVIISILATRAGAVEIGLLYWLTGTWMAMAINKMLLAVIIGVILVYLRKNKWLAVLNLGIFGLCLYNGYVLLSLLS